MNNVLRLALFIVALPLSFLSCKKDSNPINSWTIEGLTFPATYVQRDTLSPALNAVYYGYQNGTPSGGLSFRFKSLPTSTRTYKAVGISQLKSDEVIITASYFYGYGSRTLRSYTGENVIVEVGNSGKLHVSVSGFNMSDAGSNSSLLFADISE